jgi:hypothetical protein
MKIYKISTDLTEERDEYLKSNLTREEEKKIFRYFEDGNISYDLVGENGTINSYLMCSEEVLDYTKSLFYKYEVKFVISDITNDFLIGKVNIDDKDFQNYLLENLDIDTILDKINELGIESLTEVDKSILSK